ncbi:hypothetical protein GCM10010433_49280 [Streptomyces pulveraceus]
MPNPSVPSTDQVAQATATLAQAKDYLRTQPPVSDVLPLLAGLLDEDTGVPILLGDVLRSAARLITQQTSTETDEIRLIVTGLREAAQEATDWHVLHWDVQRLRGCQPPHGVDEIRHQEPYVYDPDFADKLSRLIGDHDVETTSTSPSESGKSTSVSMRQERILAADAIRALPKGTALAFATGMRAAMLDLRPWYLEPGAGELSAAPARASKGITERAVAKAAPKQSDFGPAA